MAHRYEPYGGYDQDRRPPPPPAASYGAPRGWSGPPPPQSAGPPLPHGGPAGGPYDYPPPPQYSQGSGAGPMRTAPPHARSAPYAAPPPPRPPLGPPSQNSQPPPYNPQNSGNSRMNEPSESQYGYPQAQPGYQQYHPPSSSNPPPPPPMSLHSQQSRQPGYTPYNAPPTPISQSSGYASHSSSYGPPSARGPEYERDRPANSYGHQRREPSPAPLDREAAKIEKRVAREKPCRTLFIRNVKYDSDGDLLKRKFAEYGELRTFFDLISSRGLVFITYYDLRTAIDARDGLQGFDLNNRPIDIHYSLPRDEEQNGRRKCDREKNQGTLRVVLRDCREALRESELERMFGGFGAIKGMYYTGGNPAVERLVEFFDLRATWDAYDTMQKARYPAGGYVELSYDWDVKDIPISKPPVGPKPSSSVRSPPVLQNGFDLPGGQRAHLPPPPGSGYQPQDRRAQSPQDQRYAPDRPEFRQPPPPNYMAPPPHAGHSAMPPYHNGNGPPPRAPSPRGYDRPPPARPYESHPPPTPPFDRDGAHFVHPSHARGQTPQHATPSYTPVQPQQPPQQPAPPVLQHRDQAPTGHNPANTQPSDMSTLLASLGKMPNQPENASSTRAPPQSPRDQQYTPSDPYSRPNDPDRVPLRSSGPPPSSDYRPTPPTGPPIAPPSALPAFPPPGMIPPPQSSARRTASPPPTPEKLLAMLGQQRAPANNGPPSNGTSNGPPSQPNDSSGLPSGDVNALLAMLTSQQR